jgi:Rad3-related DNA helicase
MDIDLDQRRLRMGVGELADFEVGPRRAGGGSAGLWRAQLGSEWHRRIQADSADAESEVPIEGDLAHRGWVVSLSGRIDQILPGPPAPTLREIKTVSRPIPAAASELRREYPGYFAQIAAYAELRRVLGRGTELAELVLVEASTGLSQTVALGPEDEAIFRDRLDRVVDFVERRRQARDRLRSMAFKPAFAVLRPGQENVQAGLAAAWTDPPVPVLLSAPTGFGKTGVLLEFALGQLRTGAFDRLVYLTSKSTGQLQVARTLAAMTGASGADGGQGVAAWQVRNKAEHCVNPVFHCVREACPYLDGTEDRWPESGLNRFYLEDGHPRDMETLRKAGKAARICPYEITRAALAFQQVWIADYNYVFSPSARGLFYDQPAFEPARSLLVVDEAHNLPSRAADAHSHAFGSEDAEAVAAALHRQGAPADLVGAWDEWSGFLRSLLPNDGLSEAEVDEALRILNALADLISLEPVDQARLGPRITEHLWQIPAAATQLEAVELPRLWWCQRPGRLTLTCLDAGPDIGARLREFGGVVLATATPAPIEAMAAALGLSEPVPAAPKPPPSPEVPRNLGDLGARQTRKLFGQLTSGSGLLRARESEPRVLVQVDAPAPWRDRAYRMGFDLRVDTTFQRRAQHTGTTASTIARFHADSPIAVFFPSYAYAETIARAIEADWPALRVVLQPRIPDLSLQAAWVEESLSSSDALFLILGSSFAESIDLLGGRIGRAIVVGPALPEVNPVQQARLGSLARAGRGPAFRRVYQIPGMQKVNQALGRLVRAPGQAARVLLHCRRFAEPDYAALLAPEYREGARIRSDEEFGAWLEEDL